MLRFNQFGISKIQPKKRPKDAYKTKKIKHENLIVSYKIVNHVVSKREEYRLL